jgi:hypothetical protein
MPCARYAPQGRFYLNFKNNNAFKNGKRRCAADSGSLLQSWQSPQFCHPFCYNGGPHTVLEDYPSKLFAFGRRPILPKCVHHEGVNRALKLHLVDRCRGVRSRSGEFPSDVIRGAFSEINGTYPRSKVNILRKMVSLDANNSV